MERGRLANQQLQVPAQQQNIQQARSVEVRQRFVAEADQQCSTRTLVQEAANRRQLCRVEGPAAGHGLKHVEPLVAARKKMVQAKLSSRQRNHRRSCALPCFAVFLAFQHAHGFRTRLGFRDAIQTDFGIVHFLSPLFLPPLRLTEPISVTRNAACQGCRPFALWECSREIRHGKRRHKSPRAQPAIYVRLKQSLHSFRALVALLGIFGSVPQGHQCYEPFLLFRNKYQAAGETIARSLRTPPRLPDRLVQFLCLPGPGNEFQALGAQLTGGGFVRGMRRHLPG